MITTVFLRTKLNFYHGKFWKYNVTKAYICHTVVTFSAIYYRRKWRSGWRAWLKETNMKKWILTIFRIVPKIGRRIETIDGRIERVALSPFGNTLEQCAKIIYLSGYKSRLVNIRIMYDVIVGQIGLEAARDLENYACGKSAKEIAADSGRNQYAVYRRIMKAIDAAIKELDDCGYDERRMDNDYGAMRFIKTVQAQLAGKLRSV